MTDTRRLAIATLLLLAALSNARAYAQDPALGKLQPAIAKIDAMAAAEHAKDNVGGLTIGVVLKDKLVWTKSYGYADMEKETPASAATVYRIGSITKQFTGLMLLQLVQDGRVNWSDPVEKYFPEFGKVQNRFSSAPVTLLQLASMKSGLAREPANLSVYLKGPVADWESVLITALEQTQYTSAPGTRYAYSNIGYATLGAALARAAGVPYVRYVKERILLPLDMNHTAFETTPTILPRLAQGYDVSSGGHVSATLSLLQHNGRGYKVPNGALYSTVGDLARFVSFQLGEGSEAVLNKKNLDDAFARLAWDSARVNFAYGIGVQIRRVGGLVAFGHDGEVPGYVANLRFDRTSKTGIIVLRNVNGGRFDTRGFTYAALAEVAH